MRPYLDSKTLHAGRGRIAYRTSHSLFIQRCLHSQRPGFEVTAEGAWSKGHGARLVVNCLSRSPEMVLLLSSPACRRRSVPTFLRERGYRHYRWTPIDTHPT